MFDSRILTIGVSFGEMMMAHERTYYGDLAAKVLLDVAAFDGIGCIVGYDLVEAWWGLVVGRFGGMEGVNIYL